MDCNELFYQMSLFSDRMDTIDVREDMQIILFCEELVSFVTEKHLACHLYDAYKADWERFNETRDVSGKDICELFTYVVIYSRWEHFTGDYGSCYIKSFRSGAIPALVRQIVKITEKMARSAADDSDRTGRIGVAGEYFVVAELTRRGYVASLTSKNTKTIDVLASDKSGSRSVAIQVKTCDDAKRMKWKMNDTVERTVAHNLYYVLVNMNGGEMPSFYVIPSKYVAYRVKEDYTEWLNTPGKKGQRRNATTMRTFAFVNEYECEQFRDAWYLLGL